MDQLQNLRLIKLKLYENSSCNTCKDGIFSISGKPMADILGMPMIGHCYKRAEMSQTIDLVYVATCNKLFMIILKVLEVT